MLRFLFSAILALVALLTLRLAVVFGRRLFGAPRPRPLSSDDPSPVSGEAEGAVGGRPKARRTSGLALDRGSAEDVPFTEIASERADPPAGRPPAGRP
jgi:hypothetical protein